MGVRRSSSSSSIVIYAKQNAIFKDGSKTALDSLRERKGRGGGNRHSSLFKGGRVSFSASSVLRLPRCDVERRRERESRERERWGEEREKERGELSLSTATGAGGE